MTEIRVGTQSEAYVAVIQGLLSAPVVAPRGLKVREMPERTSVVIAHPAAGFVNVEGRKLNHAITAIEGMSLVGQISAPEMVIDRVSSFAPFTDDGVFWGAYGPRIAGDLGKVIKVLRDDPDSRQAVLTLYDSGRDLDRGVKDVPCTIAIQFFLRHGWVGYEPEDEAKFLNTWVVMRSNDAWLGLPYDLGQFSLLQTAVAQALGARVGTYTHSVGSLHLYERNWEEARGVHGPGSHPTGHLFGGPGDIESTARRARRILYGDGLELDGLSELERWLVSVVDKR